jgi:hypothetical protein
MYEAVMNWTSWSDGNMECIQNVVGESSWKICTWKAEKLMRR